MMKRALSNLFSPHTKRHRNRNSSSEWKNSSCKSVDMPPAATVDEERRGGGAKWRWEAVEARSRDGRVTLSTAGYEAHTMDQHSPALLADCHTACSVLSLTIASWLLLSKACHPLPASTAAAVLMPSPPTLDALLLKGSVLWSHFLSLPTVQALSRADGLQDIDNVLRCAGHLFNFIRCAPKAAKAKTLQSATIVGAPNGSYTAFFRPSFTPATASSRWPSAVADVAVMAEACSLDSVWPSIVGKDLDNVNGEEDRTFIVGWNAHYFVLHIPASSKNIYLIDTMGSRLSPDCNKAYVLKLSADTRLTFSSTSGKTTTYTYQSAADACKAYLCHFLAAYTIREACHDFQNQRGAITQECLFQKLQIDFRRIVLRSG